jgi:DNA repair protein RecN (Recombination protein N)
MISSLRIQGLAIIDSLSIDFSPGFNVITGETGAGKSILIRGLGFLLGAKAGAESVRQGYEQATVTGEFNVPAEHAAVEMCQSLGIPIEKETTVSLIIRRQLTAKGRSQSWVNDVPVTTQPLRDLGSTLVDVFGQHENQRLMDAREHIAYIDQFLPEPNLKKILEDLDKACLEAVREVRKFLQAFESRDRSHDYLSFRREELRTFGPSADDYQKISTLCRQAESQVGMRDTLANATRCLEGEGGEPASKGLWEAARYLAQAGRAGEVPSVTALKERLEALAKELDDLSFEVGKLAGGFDIDEGELEAAQSRLFNYQDLFRKHGARDIEGLLVEESRLQTELEFLESAAENLERTLDILAAKARALRDAGEKLSREREKAARLIKRRVEAELSELAMPGSRLEVQFTPYQRPLPELPAGILSETAVGHWKEAVEILRAVDDGGAERGQFLLASNPGEPSLPLSRIASGGEMSRIMLALKKALAADAETCVLVFDEIDTGISGRVADVVGRKMRELSGAFQVICISHLPQVAVYADTHFLVRKEERGKRTESSIVRMSKEESAREIARLLSGAEVSKPGLANAKNLIARAQASCRRPTRARPSPGATK